MAEGSEPKKETVRIKVSPSETSPESATPARSGETVRIHLPNRPPSNEPPPDPPSPVRAVAAAAPAPMTTTHSPKKETARITVLPDPPAKPAVEMKKTQPLIARTEADAPDVDTRVILSEPAVVGGFITRRITGARGYDLLA